MGMSTEARLAYGYNLGGQDLFGGWRVEQADDSGRLVLPWYDPQGTMGFPEQAAVRLGIALEGLTAEQIERQEEAAYRVLSRLDAEMMVHGHLEGGQGYALVHADSISYVPTSGPRLLVEMTGPEKAEIHARWDRDLERARTALGLEFTGQDRPCWMVAAYYG